MKHDRCPECCVKTDRFWRAIDVAHEFAEPFRNLCLAVFAIAVSACLIWFACSDYTACVGRHCSSNRTSQ